MRNDSKLSLPIGRMALPSTEMRKTLFRKFSRKDQRFGFVMCVDILVKTPNEQQVQITTDVQGEDMDRF